MAKRLQPLEEKFLNTIKENNLIEKGDKIVIGVSGGPDSITLLNCFYKFKEKLKCDIIVAHINHLIREDSTEDEQYVENMCKKINIKCYIKRENILELCKKEKRGTEEIAREVRYNFFNEILKKESANKIAIAHNMNDNAETVLLNLIRGCGLIGLEGIQPKEYSKYIRPLIYVKREEIEEYCEKNKLEPKFDYTNKENIYTRNKIRNELIPYIKNINPNIINNISRLSKIIYDENLYIKNKVEHIYNKIVKYNNSIIEIEQNKFVELDKCIKQNLVLYIINNLLGNTRNIEKVNIDDIIEMCDKNIGNKYIVLNKKLKVMVKNKKIIFMAII